MENKSQRKSRFSRKKGGKRNQAKNDNDEGNPNESTFDEDSPCRTPVHIPLSPGSSIQTTGQLQGSARVVKDHCADWHNYIQKWDTLNDKGFMVANKISNLNLQSRETEDGDKAIMTKGLGSDEASHGYQGAVTRPEGLVELCNEFTEIHKSLVKLVARMFTITYHFRGICKLEMKKSSSETDTVLFKTWPVDYFYENSVELQEMYSKELEVKRTIVQDIAHQNNRDVLMTYMSTWQHQPYIEDRAATLLESMLHESGHR